MRCRWLVVVSVSLLPHLAWAATPNPRQYADAGEAYAAGEYDQALRLLLDGQVSHPKDQRFDFDIGNAHYRRGDYTAAAAAYTRALATPDAKLRAQASYNLGNALFRAQKLGDAVTAYEQALKLAPKDEDARHNLEIARRALEQQQPQQDKQQPQQDKQQPQQDKQQPQQDKQQPQQDKQQPQQDKQQPQQDKQGASDSDPTKNTETNATPQRLRREDAERYLQQLGDLRSRRPHNQRGGHSRPPLKDW